MDESQIRWCLTLPYYTKITTEMEKLSNSNSFKYGEFLTDTSNGIPSSISNAQLAEEEGKSIIVSMEG